MHAWQRPPAKGGRWVSTFASDIEVGDRIRRNGAEQVVTGWERTPSYCPTFRVAYNGSGETLAKTAVVSIWDPDGSVAARVASLSAAVIR